MEGGTPHLHVGIFEQAGEQGFADFVGRRMAQRARHVASCRCILRTVQVDDFLEHPAAGLHLTPVGLLQQANHSGGSDAGDGMVEQFAELLLRLSLAEQGNSMGRRTPHMQVFIGKQCFGIGNRLGNFPTRQQRQGARSHAGRGVVSELPQGLGQFFQLSPLHDFQSVEELGLLFPLQGNPQLLNSFRFMPLHPHTLGI